MKYLSVNWPTCTCFVWLARKVYYTQQQKPLLNPAVFDHAVGLAFDIPNIARPQVLTYPIEMYVARHVLDVSIFQTWLRKGPTTSARHYWITVVLWSLTVLLAISTKDLGSVLEIFGAFGASVSLLVPVHPI